MTVIADFLWLSPKETVRSVLNQYKIHNANVFVHQDCTVDDFIDVIDGNRKYVKCLYVYNKIDMIDLKQVDELARRDHSVVCSVQWKMNLDFLLARMWQEMQVVRIYTKKKGEFPDFKDPIVLTPQRGLKNFTVENAVTLLHKSILEEFKHAIVWGTSVKTSPQACGLKHTLHDEDVLQVAKKTQAEKVRAAQGKKTGQTIAGTNIKADPKKVEKK
ncbi:unnamed protein product [Prorocentrum cordatum]|uniref:TGS domain-containing protein n=1 Tax=Prorocentrum cordatum TaxID=2364126 RepID=A0ABN9V172_9DINO|nr:unnamed protein product [Polarella glacialis]